MKNKSRLADAFIGLLLTAFVVSAYLRLPVPGADIVERLELQSYDLRAQLRGNIDPSSDIVIVEIDEDSLDRHGRWPFPRSKIAQLIDVLERAQPRVIGLNILYSEPADNPAFAELDALKARYQKLVRARRIIARGVKFGNDFDEIKQRLNTDKRLLASLTTAQAKIILPVALSGDMVAGGRVPPVPAALKESGVRLRVVAPRPDRPAPASLPAARKISHPIDPFLNAVHAVGHVRLYDDIDGVVRSVVPVIQYGKDYLPSFPLQIAAAYLGVEPKEIEITPGDNVQLGGAPVPIGPEHTMMVTFNGGARTFRYYSFYEVLDGKVSLEVFKDKIVLVGVTAPGAADLHVTPLSTGLHGVEMVANVIENLLNRRFISRPVWAFNAELGAIAVMGLFIMFLLPRLRALSGISVSLLFIGALLGAGAYLFKEQAQWLRVSYPAFLLAAGYFVIISRRFLLSERRSDWAEASAVETNKTLGLSLQGQGQLDAAFEKFRLCPLDGVMQETVYNLGLDFERKRQYAKAVSCYQYIATEDASYKDIETKIAKLATADGGAAQAGPLGTVLTPDGAERATLGRYEIEKELGRGAMGIVYLGRDPKINRQVAIKTLMLDEGATPGEVKGVKERFFREAESAGTLNHPGIVRIFDAGEDKDVCYIAMELLHGEDMRTFTEKDKRLPLKTVLEYLATVADALDYAHTQGIVHRDIKPANIMRLEDGSIRVTDFGIARITASSKTATGTVMGTPSYMSPEQIAGKKVDGRSDLFSLGIVLYEFVCGEKPFKGGEGIGTLLFQIANDPEPDPMQIEPNTPAAVAAIMHKALLKDPNQRYASGAEMAQDLRAALAAFDTPNAEPAAVGADAVPEVEGTSTPDEVVDDLRMVTTSPDLTAEAQEAVAVEPALTEEPGVDAAPLPEAVAEETVAPPEPVTSEPMAGLDIGEKSSKPLPMLDPGDLGTPVEPAAEEPLVAPMETEPVVPSMGVDSLTTETATLPVEPEPAPEPEPAVAAEAVAETPPTELPQIDLGPRAFGQEPAPEIAPAEGIEPTQAGLTLAEVSDTEATLPLPPAEEPLPQNIEETSAAGLELPPAEFMPADETLVVKSADTVSFTPGDVAEALPTPEDAPGVEPENPFNGGTVAEPPAEEAAAQEQAVKLEWPSDPDKPA
jgi:CHASE2 domain-containing sensor protein/predicted Ser/Thr protein kinase